MLVGQPKTGKSTWLRAAIKAARGNVIAWDPPGTLKTGAGRWDFEGKVAAFLRRCVAMRGRPKRARVWGSRAEFRSLCRFVLESGQTLFAIDEAHVILPPQGNADHPFCDVMVQVRHLNVPLILVAWRPYGLPAYSRSGISRVVAFKLIDERSLDWLQREAGASDAITAKIPALPKGASRAKPRYFDWRP